MVCNKLIIKLLLLPRFIMYDNMLYIKQNCRNVICDTFTCDIGYLASQQDVSISIISRLWSATLAWVIMDTIH